MSVSDLRGGGAPFAPLDRQRSAYRSRSRGLSSIDPKFISQSGLCSSADLETASGTSIKIHHLTAGTYEQNHGKLENCAHFHYEYSDIKTILVELCDSQHEVQPLSSSSEQRKLFTVQVTYNGRDESSGRLRRDTSNTSKTDNIPNRSVNLESCTDGQEIHNSEKVETNNQSRTNLSEITRKSLTSTGDPGVLLQTWTFRRSLEDFKLLDTHIHSCIIKRSISQLAEIHHENLSIEDEESVRDFLSAYLSRFSRLAGPIVTCGPVLNWLEIDNRGNRLIISEGSDINTPAVGAAYAVKKYVKQATDEICFEVGDMISVIDMPPGDESVWWKGKRGFDCGFFPSDYVEVIGGTNVPTGLTLPGGVMSTSHPGTTIIRRHSQRAESPSEPTKPVLRKSGKVVSFFRSFILSRPTRGKLKKEGILKERVFGCDLGEHLINTGKEVPKVLHHCSSFIEAKGLVDGIYRLSGISSNIQRLRVAFDEDRLPNLFEDRLVLQDIHSVSSLLKMYFRELPNPVCTFHLYDKFVEAARSPDNDRLDKLRDVVAQLPPPNYRTLEYLTRHLYRVSLRGSETGMTAKNVAIVWAPNLLRSKSLEVGGVAALQGVGVQAVVTEYLIRYCELLFNQCLPGFPVEDNTARINKTMRPKSLAISTPTKLLSLEEARSRALSTSNNTDNQTYIEVGGGPNNLPSKYHTVIDHPRKKGGSFKSSNLKPAWKQIFAGKEKKRKISTPLAMELQAAQIKAVLRPVRSAESLIQNNTKTKMSARENSPVNVTNSETGSRPISSDMDELAPLEPVIKAVGLSKNVANKCHIRSSSHDSYFERKSSSHYDLDESQEEKMDSSLDISEIQVNFELEENEMRIFSEDEMISTSVGSDNLSSPLEDLSQFAPDPVISKPVKQILTRTNITNPYETLDNSPKLRRMSFREKIKQYTSPQLSRKSGDPEQKDTGPSDINETKSSQHEQLRRTSTFIKEKIVSALSPESLRKRPDSCREKYDASPKKKKASSSPGTSPQSCKNLVKRSKIEDYDPSLSISPSIKFIDSSSSYELAYRGLGNHTQADSEKQNKTKLVIEAEVYSQFKEQEQMDQESTLPATEKTTQRATGSKRDSAPHTYSDVTTGINAQNTSQNAIFPLSAPHAHLPPTLLSSSIPQTVNSAPLPPKLPATIHPHTSYDEPTDRSAQIAPGSMDSASHPHSNVTSDPEIDIIKTSQASIFPLSTPSVLHLAPIPHALFSTPTPPVPNCAPLPPELPARSNNNLPTDKTTKIVPGSIDSASHPHFNVTPEIDIIKTSQASIFLPSTPRTSHSTHLSSTSISSSLHSTPIPLDHHSSPIPSNLPNTIHPHSPNDEPTDKITQIVTGDEDSDTHTHFNVTPEIDNLKTSQNSTFPLSIPSTFHSTHLSTAPIPHAVHSTPIFLAHHSAPLPPNLPDTIHPHYTYDEPTDKTTQVATGSKNSAPYTHSNVIPGIDTRKTSQTSIIPLSTPPTFHSANLPVTIHPHSTNEPTDKSTQKATGSVASALHPHSNVTPGINIIKTSQASIFPPSTSHTQPCAYLPPALLPPPLLATNDETKNITNQSSDSDLVDKQNNLPKSEEGQYDEETLTTENNSSDEIYECQDSLQEEKSCLVEDFKSDSSDQSEEVSDANATVSEHSCFLLESTGETISSTEDSLRSPTVSSHTSQSSRMPSSITESETETSLESNKNITEIAPEVLSESAENNVESLIDETVVSGMLDIVNQEKIEFKPLLFTSKENSFDSIPSHPAETPPSITTTSEDSSEHSSPVDTELTEPLIKESPEETVTPATVPTATTSILTSPIETVQLRKSPNSKNRHFRTDFELLPPIPTLLKSTSPPKFMCTAKVLSPQPYNKYSQPFLNKPAINIPPSPPENIPIPSKRSIDSPKLTDVKIEPKTQTPQNKDLPGSNPRYKNSFKHLPDVETEPKTQIPQDIDSTPQKPVKPVSNPSYRNSFKDLQCKFDTSGDRIIAQVEDTRFFDLVDEEEAKPIPPNPAPRKMTPSPAPRKYSMEFNKTEIKPSPAIRKSLLSLDQANIVSLPPKHPTPKKETLNEDEVQPQRTEAIRSQEQELLQRLSSARKVSESPDLMDWGAFDIEEEVPIATFNDGRKTSHGFTEMEKKKEKSSKAKETGPRRKAKSTCSTLSLHALGAGVTENEEEGAPLQRRNSIHNVPWVDVNDPDTRTRMERYKEERRSMLRAKYKAEDYLSSEFTKRGKKDSSESPEILTSNSPPVLRRQVEEVTTEPVTVIDKLEEPIVSKKYSLPQLKQTEKEQNITPKMKKRSAPDLSVSTLSVSPRPRPANLDCNSKSAHSIYNARPAEIIADKKHIEVEEEINVKEIASIFGPRKATEVKTRTVSLSSASQRKNSDASQRKSSDNIQCMAAHNNVMSPSKIKNIAAMFEKQ